MNRLNVESNGTSTYLVYELQDGEEIDTLSLGMVVNNKISNVMPIIFSQVDNNKYFKYNISSKISLSQFFNGIVNKKRLLTVFSSVLKAIMESTEYMIDSSSFLLDPEYIYVDVSTSEAHLLCMPLMEMAEHRVEVAPFFKNIVFSTQFDQSENTDYVVKLITYLNANQTVSIEGFSEFIDELLNGPKSVKNEETSKPQQPAQPQQQQMPQNTVVKQTLTPDQMPKNIYDVPNTVNTQPPVQQPVGDKKVEKVNDKNKPAGFAVPGVNADSSKQDPKKNKNDKKDKKDNKAEHKEKKGFSLFGKKKDKNEVKDTPKADIKNSNTVNNPNLGFNIPGTGVPASSTQVKMPDIPVATPVNTPASNAPKMNFGETTVLGGATAGETTVLGVNTPSTPQVSYLIRKKNNEKILLSKELFKVGKERSFVDYCISDNNAVSRSHANIICKNGEYFVVDMNSTNHTYINGMILTPQMECKIKNGDVITFGNEDFTFHM
ncbi:MAG: DUF6382 domain-containing protein [Clostridia bacterium]|nr:DUF6382 domain-containing protein [Clostridia bacterium]